MSEIKNQNEGIRVLSDEEWDQPLDQTLNVCAIDNPDCEVCQ